jgi:hypothetical protein
VNLIAIATAYFFIYPKYAGDDVRRLAWLDTAVGATVLVVLAPFNWNTPNDYTLFVVDLNWWMFAFITYFLLELPLFYFYSKARGLGSAYREMWGLNSGFTTIASERSVKKQLSDTKWDGLRTKGALRFLVFGTNITLVVGTSFSVLVGDNDWSALTMLYIVILMIFWALLRRAVRLIPEAPESALDERMIKERDSVYYRAYQFLFGVGALLAGALFAYAVGSDLFQDGNGFDYQLNLTWPQINAIFWLVFGYGYMLPSLIMAWRESKRLTRVQDPSLDEGRK